MKKTVLRKLTSALCALVLLLSLVPPARAAGTPAVSKNMDANTYGGYTNYASPVHSYLFNNGSGLTRVERINKEIVVEDYSPSFALLSQRKIPGELQYCGGFFAGQSYNFFIFGQENPSESDSVEVVRVVKYDKNWNRLGQASVYGANTKCPFMAGSLRCAESGGNLYIHTCHEMYKSKDGKNHQANMNIAVRQSDMQLVGLGCTVGDYGNYVSHSFNQFVIVDQAGRLVFANHGDGYPRGIEVYQFDWSTDLNKMGLWSENKDSLLVSFPGAIGQNETAGALGGLAETSSGYVTAFNLDDPNSGFASRKVYLGYTDKNTMTSRITKVAQIPSLSVPHLAPTGLSGGWLLWNGRRTVGYKDAAEDTLHYVAYNADGTFGEEKVLPHVPLSDCAPIQYNGKTVWYTTNDSAPVFYCLDASGVTATPANGSPSQVVSDPTPTRPDGSGVSFSDVPASHPAYKDIASCVAKGAVSGYKDGTFHPNDPVTYAQIAAMAEKFFYPEELAKFQADPKYKGKPWYVPVMDMATGYQFSSVMYNLYYVRWDTETYANKALPRGDLATVIYRIVSVEKGGVYYKEYEYLKSQITDYPAEPYVDKKGENWSDARVCVHLGLLDLKSDGSFGLFDTVTRAEACTALVRAFDYMYG